MGKVPVPYEDLREGPWGHRVHVVDYDASLDRYRKPDPLPTKDDPYENRDPNRLILNPEFHAWNCYAIVMSTLARFEFALGRRVNWSFGGHQIKVVPHAFADANAFYSRQDESLMFGYFEGRKETIFTCLAHDVIAHETTHALLDGLRERYMDPSSPDQAGFHEGFGDVVALLSVFAMPGVVEKILDLGVDGPTKKSPARRIAIRQLAEERLYKGLLALGKQMGAEIQGVRGAALRWSGTIVPSPHWYRKDPEFRESHRRGEIIVAAVLRAFVAAWRHRLVAMTQDSELSDETQTLDRERVVEEGAELAATLLTTAIRALDYSPTTDLKFGDYLSAMLTSDQEVRPNDKKYDLRGRLKKAFADYGIAPSGDRKTGLWSRAPLELNYSGVHLASLQRDPDEVFRFLWDNRDKIEKFDADAYTQVLSVLPCTRVDPDDGFTLHETVAQYVQIRRLRADELKLVKVRAPNDMPADTEVTLYGGGALIFDEFGRLKFQIAKSVGGAAQTTQLAERWESGAFEGDRRGVRRFAGLHLRRAAGGSARKEEW